MFEGTSKMTYATKKSDTSIAYSIYCQLTLLVFCIRTLTVIRESKILAHTRRVGVGDVAPIEMRKDVHPPKDWKQYEVNLSY